VMLCLEIMSFALYLHPPRRCVLARGWLHFLKSIGLIVCFLLQRWTCVLHATSYESRRHLYGDRECACMLKSVPVSLAAFRSALKTPLVVMLCDVSLVSFLMPIFRLIILRMVSGLSGVVRLIYSHVRRPPMGGSASSNVMSGGASPSTTTLAAVSVS
jgi:hypothetical protein